VKNQLPATQMERLGERIFTVRGQRVMLDSDLAAVYGVLTRNLNKAVKRNRDRFTDDFAFLLTRQEVANLKFQIGTSSLEHGGRRKPMWAFTEHGALMAANVLNSKRAAQMSVFVVRAFVKMRAVLSDNRQLARKLAALEKELKERLGVHDAAIVSILQRVMDIIDPPALPEPPKRQIGFQAKEGKARYVVRRKTKRKDVGITPNKRSFLKGNNT
jgi:phage regulator Rha-like protein